MPWRYDYYSGCAWWVGNGGSANSKKKEEEEREKAKRAKLKGTKLVCTT